jgi:hypothetical protein
MAVLMYINADDAVLSADVLTCWCVDDCVGVLKCLCLDHCVGVLKC